MLNKEAKIHENLEFLRRFVGNPHNPKFFFTMTEINKVGINPGSTYDTPLGVYCYPLIPDFYQKLLTNALPFAGSKPYINLFTLNVPTFNMTNYTDADLRRDLDKLKLIYGISEAPGIDPALQQKFDAARKAYEAGDISYSEFNKVSQEYYKVQEEIENKITQHTVDKAFREAKGGTPIGKFWNLTRILSGNAKAWSHLLRRLGYTNFYDPDTGLIHSNEPTQMVILDPSVIIIVESFINPHTRIDEYAYPHVPKHEKKMMQQRQTQMENLVHRLQNLNNPIMLDKIAHSHIKNPQIMNSIISNSHTTSETLRFIYSHLDNPSELAYSFISNPNTTADILTKIWDLGVGYKESIIQHQNAPIELLQRMANSEDYEERYLAASSRRLTPELARKLIKDENPSVRDTAIYHAPVEVLQELLADENLPDEVKTAVIDSNNLTPELLTMLIGDKSPIIRAKVAGSNRATPEILQQFAHDPSKHVRLIVAQNERTDQGTLMELAKDPEEDVVISVARNYYTSPKVLEKLAHDSRDEVRYQVVFNENTPKEAINLLAHDTSPKVLEAIISHIYNMSPELIQILADNPHSTRRIFTTLVQNPQTPMEVMMKVLQNPEYKDDEYMLSYIANNSNISPEMLEMVAQNPSPSIQAVVARNKQTSPELLNKIVNKFYDDRYVMESVVKNPNVTPEILDRLSRNDAAYIRRHVARKSQTPYTTLLKLTKDPDYDVRWYAERELEEHPGREAYEEEERQRQKQKLFQKGPIMANTKFDIQKTAKKEDNEKIPMSQVKKLPYKSLNRMIKKMKQYLKDNDVVQKMFKDYNVDISEIDYIPMMFGNLDVSAKTDHGVIILNYKLLTDGDFFKDFSYGVHEMTHWLQQTTGQKATRSSDDGSYLDNPYEQEGFQNQVEYIAEQFGEDEAENYVDDLLEHHEIDNKKEHEEKKDTLMSKVKVAATPIVTFDYDNTIWDPQHHEYIADSVKLLRDYIKEGAQVAIVTHRDKQRAKEARNRLKSIDINIPVISCPGETFQSRAINKNQVLLALGVKIHYDDHPEYLKDAIAGGVNVRRPPATRYNQ